MLAWRRLDISRLETNSKRRREHMRGDGIEESQRPELLQSLDGGRGAVEDRIPEAEDRGRHEIKESWGGMWKRSQYFSHALLATNSLHLAGVMFKDQRPAWRTGHAAEQQK